LGHLLRTRTFAKEAKKSHKVEIIAIVEKDLEFIFFEISDVTYFVKEDTEILPYITKFSPDILLFDLTFLNKKVFDQARNFPRLTASLSPIFEHMTHVDVYFSRSNRTQQIPYVKVYGGLEYAIFNDQCKVIDDITYAHNLNLPSFSIAVCMGGADAANKTLKVLRAIMNMKYSSTIWVLLGEGYSYSYDELVKTVRGHHQHEVILAKTNQSMWRILSNCVLAILAGGLTSIEAVYAGLPTINLFEGQDHIDAMSKKLFDLGVCLNGGIYSKDSLNKMVSLVQDLYNNRKELLIMRNLNKGLVDKNGSMRVIEALELQLKNKTKLSNNKNYNRNDAIQTF
jgi:spore coat polysaccharide biosynthesis predicted glycosyltransferase SpsG